MAAIYDRVALIGLGLIAGSMSLAMREAGLAREVVGHARSPETRAVAREIGLVDLVVESAGEAVKGADLVVLAVAARYPHKLKLTSGAMSNKRWRR